MKTTNTNGAAKPKANRLPKIKPAKELHPDEKDVLYQESLERFNASQSAMPRMMPLWVWLRLAQGFTGKYATPVPAWCKGRNIYYQEGQDRRLAGRVPDSLKVAKDPSDGAYWIGEPAAIAEFKRCVKAFEYAKAAVEKFEWFDPVGFKFEEVDADDEDMDDDEEADE